jgi:hypothetical protein
MQYPHREHQRRIGTCSLGAPGLYSTTSKKESPSSGVPSTCPRWAAVRGCIDAIEFLAAD